MAAQQVHAQQHWVWQLGRTPTQQPCHPLLHEAGAYSNGMRVKGIGAQLSLLKKRTITALTATRFCCTAEKTPRRPVPCSYHIPLLELKPAMALPTQKGHARAGEPSLCSSTLEHGNHGTGDPALWAHTATQAGSEREVRATPALQQSLATDLAEITCLIIMQVRYVIANVTEAEERIVISLEEGEEPPSATRHSSTSGCSWKASKSNSGEEARANLRSKAWLSPAHPAALGGYGATTDSDSIHTDRQSQGLNCQALLLPYNCYCDQNFKQSQSSS